MAQRRQRTRGEQDLFHILQTRLRLRPDDSSLARREEDAPSSTQGEPSGDTTPREELRGVYVISVAASLLEMHPQTLRKYERLGLIRPARTVGMLRLYSQEDIERLRLIKYLEGTLGFNLAGVEWALNLLTQLLYMRQRLGTAQDMERIHLTLQQEMDRLFQALNLPIE